MHIVQASCTICHVFVRQWLAEIICNTRIDFITAFERKCFSLCKLFIYNNTNKSWTGELL